MVLMRGYNICFCEEIRKSFLNYPQYPLLSGAMVYLVRPLSVRDPEFFNKKLHMFYYLGNYNFSRQRHAIF